MVIAVLIQWNSYLFTICLYSKYHRILYTCLTPFRLPWSLIGQVRNYISFFSHCQSRCYSLLLLVCVTHPLKIIFLYCRHLIFTFCFCKIFYSHSTFIKLHSAVIAITAVLFLQFCSSWSSSFSTLLQTSKYTLLFSHTIVPIALPCFTYILNFVLLNYSPQLYPYSYQFSSISPLNNIFPSFSNLIFHLSYLIISAISLKLYESLLNCS